MNVLKTDARWPRYEADGHPNTWIVKDTPTHPTIKHVAVYRYPVPNVDIEGRSGGIWAEIGGYQDVNYFLEIQMSLPNRSRQQFNYHRRFQRWEDAEAKAFEMILKGKRILLRSQSLYSDAHTGYHPPYYDSLLQIWLAPPGRTWPCGCRPGRVLCPEAQAIWDSRMELVEIRWGNPYIDDIHEYRARLAQFEQHYQSLAA